MKGSKTLVTHAKSGDTHAVAAELRVLVCPSENGDYYVAQGVDIDYTATGTSEEDVREKFAEGFVRTIMACLRRKKNVDSLFKTPVDAEVRRAYFAAAHKANRSFLKCVLIQGHEKGIPTELPVPRSLRFVSPTVCA